MQVGAGAMTAGTSAMLQVPRQIQDQFHKLDLKCKSLMPKFQDQFRSFNLGMAS